jgi:hypothetical protein
VRADAYRAGPSRDSTDLRPAQLRNRHRHDDVESSPSRRNSGCEPWTEIQAPFRRRCGRYPSRHAMRAPSASPAGTFTVSVSCGFRPAARRTRGTAPAADVLCRRTSCTASRTPCDRAPISKRRT